MKIALASVNKLFAISELITRHSQYWLPCIYVSFSSVYLLQALVSKRHNGKGRPELHSRSKFANLTGTLDGVERSVLYERAVDHGRGRDIYGYNASGTASPLAHLACASRTRGVRIDCRRPSQSGVRLSAAFRPTAVAPDQHKPTQKGAYPVSTWSQSWLIQAPPLRDSISTQQSRFEFARLPTSAPCQPAANDVVRYCALAHQCDCRRR